MTSLAHETPGARLSESWLDRLGVHYALIPAVVMPLAIVLAPTNQLIWLALAYPWLVIILERLLPRSRPGLHPAKLMVGDFWFYLFVACLWTLTLLIAYLVMADGDPALRLRLHDIYHALGLHVQIATLSPDRLFTLAVVLGLLYGVNTNVAHDLIHRTGSVRKRFAGFLLFSLCGDGQLAVSHMHGHHVNVALPHDPATSRAGETLYRFFFRSTVGQYRESWTYEHNRLAALGAGSFSLRNRVVSGVLITLLMATLFGWIAGWKMIAIYLFACFMGKFLFETANYVQHYGIVRLPGTKCAARHSWDSDASFSRTFMFNQNRHAQHHARAGLQYWELEVMDESPKLPYGYLTMFLVAMVPPFWFRMMEPCRIEWLRKYATDGERRAAAACFGPSAIALE